MKVLRRILPLAALSLALLAQTTPTTHTATIAWSASASSTTPGFSGYNVREAPGACGTSGQVFTLLTPAPITTTSYSSTGIADTATQVCFSVTAVRSGVESVPVTVTASVPPFPAGAVAVQWQQ